MLVRGQMFGILPSLIDNLSQICGRNNFATGRLFSSACACGPPTISSHGAPAICGSPRAISALRHQRFPRKLKSEIATEDAPCAFFLAARTFISRRRRRRESFYRRHLITILLSNCLFTAPTDRQFSHTLVEMSHSRRWSSRAIISLAAAFPPEAN
jgi:hypothetical protein